MDTQICASCFVVDFSSRELLMVYNKKLGKWLQPGGHVEGEEAFRQTAIREVKEETDIDTILIGNKFQNKIQPFAVEKYSTRIGKMLDIQFIGIPRNKKITNKEDNNARWISFEKMMDMEEIDDEIKEKFSFILSNYKTRIIEDFER